MSFDQALPVGQAEIKVTSIPAFHEHIVGGRAVLLVRKGIEVAQAQNWGNEKMPEALERGGIWVSVSGWEVRLRIPGFLG